MRACCRILSGTMAMKHEILFSVTDEQEHSIMELYSEKRWKYANLMVNRKAKTQKKKRKDSDDLLGPYQPTRNDPSGPQPSPPPPPPPPNNDDEEQQECPQCFLTPCVTFHNHYWLGDGQPESRENHRVRKIKYKSYWKVINNSGGWNDERYLQKKVTAGGPINDKRELMPSCVVSQLRALYPNPVDMPYMGHMWV